MVCSAWPVSAATALERLPGVKRAEVSLEQTSARVEFDDSKISADKLVAAIDRLGYTGKVLSVEPGNYGGGGGGKDRRRPCSSGVALSAVIRLSSESHSGVE